MSKINLYTFFTESHEYLLNNYFLPSFQSAGLANNFNLNIIKCKQYSESGSFNTHGFHTTMLDKLKILIHAAENNDRFVFADCDIQFFKNIYNDVVDIDGYDLVAQNDLGSVCAGFLIINSSENLKNFLRFVYEQCEANPYKYPNDQVCINTHLDLINYKLLPIDKYYSVGNYNQGQVWNGEDISNAPNDLILHHANFTIGVDNKIKLMNIIKKKQYV